MEAARQDGEVARILETLPTHQREVLQDPASYTGDAAARTIATCDIWQKRLKPLRDRISGTES